MLSPPRTFFLTHADQLQHNAVTSVAALRSLSTSDRNADFLRRNTQLTGFQRFESFESTSKRNGSNNFQ